MNEIYIYYILPFWNKMLKKIYKVIIFLLPHYEEKFTKMSPTTIIGWGLFIIINVYFIFFLICYVFQLWDYLRNTNGNIEPLGDHIEILVENIEELRDQLIRDHKKMEHQEIIIKEQTRWLLTLGAGITVVVTVTATCVYYFFIR